MKMPSKTKKGLLFPLTITRHSVKSYL